MGFRADAQLGYPPYWQGFTLDDQMAATAQRNARVYPCLVRVAAILRMHQLWDH
jgi:hypothetical protein